MAEHGDAVSPHPSDPVVAIEAHTCRFPLSAPIELEHATIREREYVIVRVTAESGLTGVAYGLSRGAPVAGVVESVVAPVIIGRDALGIPSITEAVARALILLGTEGVVQRAISLVDVALWDVKAKTAALPLWRLLGGYRMHACALLVDSYPRSGRTPDDVTAGLARRAAEGYRALKVHADPGGEEMVATVHAARAAVGQHVELVLDAAMSWKRPADAIRAIRQLDDEDVAWVEDPFRAEEVNWLARLRESVQTPIGAGDEVTNTGVMRTLIERGAVDVVRLDVTTHGGFSGVAELAALASRRGIRVSTHVFPELHQHCSFAWPWCDQIEIFAPKTPFDSAESFVAKNSQVRARKGMVTAPVGEGLGLEIDWAAVHRHAI